LEASEL